MKTARYSIKERVGQYRTRMQARGFRQINIWVPDTRAPAFAKECRRQSLLAAKADRKEGIFKEIEGAARDVEGWTP